MRRTFWLLGLLGMLLHGCDIHMAPMGKPPMASQRTVTCSAIAGKAEIRVVGGYRYGINGSRIPYVGVQDWRLGHGTELGLTDRSTMLFQNGQVTAVAVSPDGKRMLVGTATGCLLSFAWKGKPTITTTNCQLGSAITALALGATAGSVLVGCRDGSVYTGSSTRLVHRGNVRKPVLSIGGGATRIATRVDATHVQIWRLKGLLSLLRTIGFSSTVSASSLSPAGDELAVIHGDTLTRVNLSTGRKMMVGGYSGSEVAFGSRGLHIFSAPRTWLLF